jgi:hypothetical protein
MRFRIETRYMGLKLDSGQRFLITSFDISKTKENRYREIYPIREIAVAWVQQL